MSSFRAKLINTGLRLTVKPFLLTFPINKKSLFYPRLLINSLGQLVPNAKNTSVRPFYIDDIPCEWVSCNSYDPSENEKTKVILYLHGGGYIVGSPKTHRQITSRLALMTGARVLAVDYRKGPDHLYPAAHHDALTAYSWLLKKGYISKNIAIVGDSAGGNLSIGLSIILRDKGMSQPAALGLMSPWTNMSATFNSNYDNRKTDPYLPYKRLKEAARLYAGNKPLNDPMLSPVFADLNNLPPTIIHCSNIEIIMDDSKEFAKSSISYGNTVELKIFDGVPHVWQFFNIYLPEAYESLREISDFLIKHWE